MRYVQQWVSCSRPDCESKAEHLVPLEIGIGADGRVEHIFGDTLPEGWSWISSDPDHAPNVRETFCPMHSDPTPSPAANRDLSKHLQIAELVIQLAEELRPSITMDQIHAIASSFTQTQLVYLMTILELVNVVRVKPPSAEAPGAAGITAGKITIRR